MSQGWYSVLIEQWKNEPRPYEMSTVPNGTDLIRNRRHLKTIWTAHEYTSENQLPAVLDSQEVPDELDPYSHSSSTLQDEQLTLSQLTGCDQ